MHVVQEKTHALANLHWKYVMTFFTDIEQENIFADKMQQNISMYKIQWNVFPDSQIFLPQKLLGFW